MSCVLIYRQSNHYFNEDGARLAVLRPSRYTFIWTRASTGVLGDYPDEQVVGTLESETRTTDPETNFPVQIVVRIVGVQPVARNTQTEQQHINNLFYIRIWQELYGRNIVPIELHNWISEGF